jgi:transposase-like protein
MVHLFHGMEGSTMGQVLHGSATTTEAIRRAIQNSQESLRALAKRYGINQKTVAKWKKRTSVADLPTGPKEPKSTVLSIEEEAIIVAFRGTRCCRWMIASMRCSRPSRT